MRKNYQHNKGSTMNQIIIENDGPVITDTNYWESLYNKQGVLYLSVNAGAFRLLLPDGILDVNEMLTAKKVVISIGPGMGRHQMIELMFDDESDNPYTLHFGSEQIDRIPDPKDNGKEFRFIAYKKGLQTIMNTTCGFRFVSKIPNMQPWKI